MSGFESKSPRARGRLQRWAIAVFTVLLVDQLAVWIYEWYATTAFGHTPASTADAAVVLFSAFGSDGSLDTETRRRLEHGVLLYRRGAVRSLLCSGGARMSKRHQGADLMAAYLQTRGIAPEKIHSERLSYDTWTNIEQSLAFARRRGWASLVFVSSPAHMPRIRFFARSDAMRLEFSAYSAWSGRGLIGPLERIGQVHHEWFAWAGYALLPPTVYRAVIGAWRGSESHTNPQTRPDSPDN